MSFNLTIIIPTDEQIRQLFAQLMVRKHNISHKLLPSFDEHEYFVLNNPYRIWFMINFKNVSVGNIYVQYDNSIGLNIDDNIEEHDLIEILSLLFEKVEPLKEAPSLRFGQFYFNVPSSNKKMQSKLTRLGYVEVQRSFIAKT